MDATLLAAVAASLAAVLSGLTLWLGVLREERKWRRDSLVDTLADFLDASFARPGNIAFQSRSHGVDISPIRQTAQEAHSRQIRALTRLRLLGSRSLVQKAIELYDIENEISQIVLGDAELPISSVWTELYERRRECRNAVLKEARATLRLGRTRPLESGLHRPLPIADSPGN